MPDELTAQGTLSTEVAPTTTPTESEGQPTEETTGPVLDPNVVKGYLASNPDLVAEIAANLDEERLRKLPAVNQAIDRFVAHKSRELEHTYSQAAQERTAAQRWNEYFEGLDEGRQLAELKKPEVRANYNRVQQLLAAPAPPGTQDEVKVADRIWQGAQAELKKRYPKADFTKAEDLAMAVDVAAQSVVGDALKSLRDELRQENKASMAELRAELNLSAEQPDKLPIGGRVPSNIEGRVTRAQVAALSPAEYAAKRANIHAQYLGNK